MSDRSASRLAWALAICCFAMAGASLVLLFTTGAVPDDGTGLSNIVPPVTFGALGGLVASRQPKNAIGWLMLAIAICTGAAAAGFYVAKHALMTGVSPNGWPRWVAWEGAWITALALGSLTLVFLLFPDGKALNKRWGWVGRVTVLVSVGFAVGSALDPAPYEISPRLAKLQNPVGVSAATGFSNSPAFFLILILLLLAIAALLLRLRRSHGEVRQQLKWFVYAAGVSVGMLLLAIPASALSQPLSDAMFALAFNLGFALAVPLAATLAILRYGLYDIDVVINKTVVYGLLAAFFTAVYVAVVVGIGTAVGSTHNPFLTLLAAAVIALAFNPVRERAKRLADRLVYGERATPYEVLSEFSERMAGTYGWTTSCPTMARVLAEGTGGRSEIWLRGG